MYTWINFERAFHRVICLVCHYTHVSFLILSVIRRHSAWLVLAFILFQSSNLSRSFVHSPITIILVETMWNECVDTSVCVFTTYIWMEWQTCKSHFFPKIEISESEIKSEKTTCSAHVMHCSQIEFDNMLFSMPFIRDFYRCYCCYVFSPFSLSRPLSANKCERKKYRIRNTGGNSCIFIRFNDHQQNKLAHTFLPCDEQINEQTTPSGWAGGQGSWTHKPERKPIYMCD